jgi:hypothetical protein
MQIDYWDAEVFVPGCFSHHEEKGSGEFVEELWGIGGDRLSPGAPGQRVEPRLADHIQVGADVSRRILTGGGTTHSQIMNKRIAS